MKQGLLSILLIIFLMNFSSAQHLSEKQIKEITDLIPELISKHYVFKDKGKQIAQDFQKLTESEKYLSYENPDTLAAKLSKDLRKISSDGHMYVLTKERDTDKSWEELEKDAEIKKNYGFETVQILENNVGYIKITKFMHPKRSMQTAVAAMKLVENTNKLIIDIRGNVGGYPGIMLYILNHYFDGPPTLLSTTYSSNTEEGAMTTYTSDLVYGKLRVDTPLFIIIDRGTASAAEYFAYTAQAFEKATVIGEKSAGGAYMSKLYALPYNFKISISAMAPVNAKTKSNWEIKGVVPDYYTERNISVDRVIELIEGIMKNK
ncbi:S41 family peptidase [Galbibacter pacificus]|uniref:S41 family peptidase n=1 Tax=Galbibacter pacificus TaxID=2996052 RepID=A0ABT6FQZ3_9FLAO|nr:S41 family peptidase [Galbibacter pacificus]MDG3581832.1 S41 family peptidase [Galbibacter pacificus]MDG3585694.1 S41 family peptidase [Galbibacter pacificus]